MASMPPKKIAAVLLRVTFGLSLLCIGIVNYMSFTTFKGMAAEDLGFLSFLGTMWAYLAPAMMIGGGALFVIGLFREIAAWLAGIALGSIAVGMLLKSVLSGLPLDTVMAMVDRSFLWMLLYFFVVKSSSCCGASSGCGSEGACCGGKDCQ